MPSSGLYGHAWLVRGDASDGQQVLRLSGLVHVC